MLYNRGVGGTLLATLGENIRRYREQHGWSQAELGRRADVEYSTINALESGEQKGMRSDRLHRVAAALGVEVGELLETLTQNTPPTQELRDKGLSEKDLAKLTGIWARLSPRGRARWLDRAEELIEVEEAAQATHPNTPRPIQPQE